MTHMATSLPQSMLFVQDFLVKIDQIIEGSRNFLIHEREHNARRRETCLDHIQGGGDHGHWL